MHQKGIYSILRFKNKHQGTHNTLRHKILLIYFYKLNIIFKNPTKGRMCFDNLATLRHVPTPGSELPHYFIPQETIKVNFL